MEEREDAERGHNHFNNETFGESLDDWIWPDTSLNELVHDHEIIRDCVCLKLLFQRRRTKLSHVNFLLFFNGDLPAFDNATDPLGASLDVHIVATASRTS